MLPTAKKELQKQFQEDRDDLLKRANDLILSFESKGKNCSSDDLFNTVEEISYDKFVCKNGTVEVSMCCSLNGDFDESDISFSDVDVSILISLRDNTIGLIDGIDVDPTDINQFCWEFYLAVNQMND